MVLSGSRLGRAHRLRRFADPSIIYDGWGSSRIGGWSQGSPFKPEPASGTGNERSRCQTGSRSRSSQTGAARDGTEHGPDRHDE